MRGFGKGRTGAVTEPSAWAAWAGRLVGQGGLRLLLDGAGWGGGVEWADPVGAQLRASTAQRQVGHPGPGTTVESVLEATAKALAPFGFL